MTDAPDRYLQNAPDCSYRKRISNGIQYLSGHGSRRNKKIDPPYGGTIFIDPDIILEDSDPSTFLSSSYSKTEERLVFDRRTGSYYITDVYVYNAEFENGCKTVEFQVNTEFSREEADEYVAMYGYYVGQLGRILRKHLDTVTIHDGIEPFGGGNSDILIHVGQGVQYAEEGILGETLVHEAVHMSLDNFIYCNDLEAWDEAVSADSNQYISTYGQDYPYREDVAESFLLYYAARYRTDTISNETLANIESFMFNRMDYFDSLNLDMTSMVGVPVPEPQQSNEDFCPEKCFFEFVFQLLSYIWYALMDLF